MYLNKLQEFYYFFSFFSEKDAVEAFFCHPGHTDLCLVVGGSQQPRVTEDSEFLRLKVEGTMVAVAGGQCCQMVR